MNDATTQITRPIYPTYDIDWYTPLTPADLMYPEDEGTEPTIISDPCICGRKTTSFEYCNFCETLIGALAHLTAEIWEVNEAKGWNYPLPEEGTLLALVHSEISEALEALREGDPSSEKLGDGFTQAEEECADAIIRLLHMSRHKGWNLGAAILKKLAYNRTRPYRHGGKRF